MFSRENNDSHKEERYQFMREQVKPQRKKQCLIWAKRLGILIVSACIFGGIAGGAICLITSRAKKNSTRNVVKINTYSATAAATAEPQETPATGGSNNSSRLTTENMNRMSEQLAAIGGQASASIVGVKNKTDAQDWFSEKQNNSKNVSFGIIYKENTKNYYIATTYNIVKEQHTVSVQLADETVVEGKVLDSDLQYNVAVITISKSKITQETQEKMHVAELGYGGGLRNGSDVIAIGCPNGVLYSVMTGHVSNNILYGTITDGEVKLFSTDIPYSEDGNGVVLDISGNVVGMITTKFTIETGTSGMGFIDMSNVSTILELLQHKQDVAYLGIEGESILEATASAHDLPTGAYVRTVYAQAPAYQAGMRVADIITKIDDSIVGGMTDVYNILLQHNSGEKVICTVMRKSGDKYITKKLKVKLQ